MRARASNVSGTVLSNTMLGRALLALDQPATALKEYEASQQREPNRFRGWYGAAMAAAKSGETAKAKKYFSTLTKLTEKGDVRPELQQARQQLAAR